MERDNFWEIERIESTERPEGSPVLVTLRLDDEAQFWLQASQTALDAVWNNPEEDLYAQ